MIIRSRMLSGSDRIRLIAIETMKGAFGNEGALRFFSKLPTLQLRPLMA